MAVTIYNILITTGRSIPDANGQSLPPQPWLVDLPAHIERVNDIMSMPPGVVKANYKLMVDPHTDVQFGDEILSMTELLTGLPYPGDSPALASGLPGASNATWWIESALEGPPGFLATRDVYLFYDVGGGPRATQVSM